MIYFLFPAGMILSYPIFVVTGSYIMDHLDGWIDNVGRLLSPPKEKLLSYVESPEFYAAECEVEDYLRERAK